jgi:hypothetical protein
MSILDKDLSSMNAEEGYLVFCLTFDHLPRKVQTRGWVGDEHFF